MAKLGLSKENSKDKFTATKITDPVKIQFLCRSNKRSEVEYKDTFFVYLCLE